MRHTLAFILLLLSCGMVSVHAQTTMTLQQCLDMAHSKNISVKNGALAVERAEQLQKTAFTLQPTEITLAQDLTDGTSIDNSVGITQEFELPWVYSSRRKALKAQTMVESRKQEVTLLELDQAIAAAYYNIMYIREKLHILMQQDSAYTKSHIVAAARERAGETGRLAHINADKLIDESRLTLQNTKTDYLQAQQQLAMLINSDILVEPAEQQLTIIAAPTTDDIANNAYDRLSSAEITAAQRALTETQHEALPTVSLEARYYALIKGLNPYHFDRSPADKGNGFVLFGVGVNVPLSFGAHSAKVKAAKRDLDIQNNNKLLQQQQIKALVQQQQYECEKAMQTISYFKAKGIKQADDLTHIAQVSYEQGEIDYIELMDNYRTASEMRLQYIDAVNQYNQAMIKRPTPTLP